MRHKPEHKRTLVIQLLMIAGILCVILSCNHKTIPSNSETLVYPYPSISRFSEGDTMFITGPYLLAWDASSKGYRIAYIDENLDDVEWLWVEDDVRFKSVFNTVHIAGNRKMATLFCTKEEAIYYIHKHWKQVMDDQEHPLIKGRSL